MTRIKPPMPQRYGQVYYDKKTNQTKHVGGGIAGAVRTKPMKPITPTPPLSTVMPPPYPQTKDFNFTHMKTYAKINS